MQYTLMNNFMPCGLYDGEPGIDSHGKYILFSPNIYGMITVSNFLKTSSGELIQIQEQDSQVVNGIRYLKLYYK